MSPAFTDVTNYYSAFKHMQWSLSIQAFMKLD